MKNLVQKGNFRFDIPDNRLSETFQWQVQELTFPSVQIETARVVRSPKLSNTLIAGTGTTYDNIQITFLLDENLTAYAELYSWMLTMQNPNGPTTESASNVPRTSLLHIMNNTKEDIVVTFKFHRMFPVSLDSIDWNYTEVGDLESMTCVATFQYEYFDMITTDGVVSPRPAK